MTGYVKVAKAHEIAPGSMKAVEVDGVPLVLCNVDGKYYALHDECTHENYPLSEGTLEGCALVCMLHGATFALETGDVLEPPAYEAVRTYAVKQEGGDVYVAVEP